MNFIPVLPIKKALNKAYLRRPVERAELLRFKAALNRLFDALDEGESEEHCKNLFADFLKEAFYRDRNAINTKGRVDLAIYSGTKGGDKPLVLFEVKRPANFQEMFSEATPNAKALHELILYHLRERLEWKNLELKHLAITNVHELYIFDARDFEATFAKDRSLVHAFEESERGAGLALGARDFYSEIAKPFVASANASLEYLHLSLIDIDRASRSHDFDLTELILPYKLLSPAHLLKEPFQNDSNSLDKTFYAELLHLMGLEERKDGSKLVISRPEAGARIPGSLIELAAEKLELSGGLDRLGESERYGDSEEDRAFVVVLELVLLWVNRLLFMKLLEAQILEHRGGDDAYRFLTKEALPDFEALHELFFGVLAKRQEERHERLAARFGRVPYLNSSLFEEGELEKILSVDRLNARIPLCIHGRTVLKDGRGERLSGELPVLEYLLAFLEAYDFSAEGEGAAVERGKTLISASVLGLIFEKINGYKEGSFYTPGYVTQYMAKNTVESVVLRKFSALRGREYSDLGSLSNDLGTSSAEILEANAVFDTLRIVDPAVGSGHFLVSVLNELVAAKSELGILADHHGKRLKGVRAVVENDELFLIDEEDASFATYHAPFGGNERQRLRETIFEEKRRLIENCLFGVDLNRNSIQICKLRLWIELLKSAYYTEESGYAELETLPNIDVNIKCGNSLVARYPLDMDLAAPLRKKGWNVAHWMNAIRAYQNASTKHEKKEAEAVMKEMRNALAGAAYDAMPDRLKLIPLKGELTHLEAPDLIAREAKDAKSEARIEKLRSQVAAIEERLASDDANPIFREAFEWRYEFPEVLDADGAFVGFDAVIGNPPYVLLEDSHRDNRMLDYFRESYKSAKYKIDLYHLFLEKALQIIRTKGLLSFITPSNYLTNNGLMDLRRLIITTSSIDEIRVFKGQVFPEASVDTAITIVTSEVPERDHFFAMKRVNTVSHDVAHIGNINQLAILANVHALIVPKESIISIPVENIGNLVHINFGMQLRDRKIFQSDVIMTGDTGKTIFHQECYTGKNIKRYSVEYSGLLAYVNEEARQGGCWDLNRHKANPKILIPQVGKRPVAGMDCFARYCLNTIFMISMKTESWIDLWGLLGLLNSKLIGYYWERNFYDQRDTFPKIKGTYLKELPIPILIDKGRQQPLAQAISSVARTIMSKKIDSAADFILLDSEIDDLVYQLYGLTEKEITVVEGRT